MKTSMFFPLFISVLGSVAAVTQAQPVPAQTKDKCEFPRSSTACALNENVENGLEMLQYRASSSTGSQQIRESKDGIAEESAEEKENEEDGGVDHEDAEAMKEEPDREEDAGLALLEEHHLEGEQYTTNVTEDEGQNSSGCPRCRYCKNKCEKDLTHIAQCPGFGGSKWHVFVKAEPYVKSTGRKLYYINPHELSNVGCEAWGRRGPAAFKFKLKGWATTAGPNVAQPWKKTYTDVNMVKTNICRCSSDKKCTAGRATDIFLKINMKSGTISCHTTPNQQEKDALAAAFEASKNSRFSSLSRRRRPSSSSRRRPAAKPKPKWTKIADNCKCTWGQIKKFSPQKKKDSADKCGAECQKNGECKSFAVWKKGWCMLFNSKCKTNCVGGKKTRGRGDNGKNTAYNMN